MQLKSVSRACSLLNVGCQERVSAQATPQLGCSPAPHSPASGALSSTYVPMPWPGFGPSPWHCPALGLPVGPQLPCSWLGWWNGPWQPSPSLMDSHGTSQPQGVLGPKWHPDGGSWSFLENFSPLSSVLLPKDSGTKSLIGMHRRKMCGKLRVEKKVICSAFSPLLLICLCLTFRNK